ncbi:MAG: two-component system sensor histidine kinase NtrB [Thermodesulfobacteriota bacterium]
MTSDFKKNDDEFYKKFFDSFSDGIIITDKDLVISDINDSAQLLLNISSKQAINKKLSKIFSPDITNLAEKSIKEERSITEDEIETGVFLNEPVNLQITFTPYLSDIGNAEGLIIQLKDIEGIKFLSGINNQQSYSANIENLILGMAHELKNPLSGIKGAAQLLTGNPSEKELNKCSEIIVKEANRLIELLDRMKNIDDFSEEQFSLLDINETLLDISYLESKALESKIEIIKNLDVTIPPIKGDENSIRQVFINILQNAVQSIPDKGNVTISTRWVNDYKIKSKSAILISVKDTGSGIKKDKIDKIFAPFFTTKSGGTGLGLFISNRIISKHGGAIFVDSKPGEGAEFKVYLPA